MKRQIPLNTANTYHVYSKSISHFKIYNNPREYERFIQLTRYYQFNGPQLPFSKFLRHIETHKSSFEKTLLEASKEKACCVHILAYCLMPTHFHFILRQTCDNGIENFMRKVCNGYSHYFNLRHNRKGPLWQTRFGNVMIHNPQDLLETSRYVHLNPATAYIVDLAEHWPYSSFREYTRIKNAQFPNICHTEILLKHTTPEKYAAFVNGYVQTQRQLKPRQNPELPKVLPN